MFFELRIVPLLLLIFTDLDFEVIFDLPSVDGAHIKNSKKRRNILVYESYSNSETGTFVTRMPSSENVRFTVAFCDGVLKTMLALTIEPTAGSLLR